MAEPDEHEIFTDPPEEVSILDCTNFAEVKALAAEYPPDEQLQFWADTAKTFFNAYRALLESTTIPPASPAPSLQQPTSTMPQHTGTLLTSTTLPFDASSQKFKHDAFYGDQKNFLTTSGNSVALPKLLKGYELQDMANKAHTEAKKHNVHDYASLRRLQQGLAEFLSNAGFHALSQIIVTEGDPDHIVDTFQSYYTAHKTSSTSLDDLDKAIIQDNDLLLQLLSKTFTWHETIRGHLKELRTSDPPCAKDRIGLAALTIVREQYRQVHLDSIIKATFRILTHFTTINNHKSFESWLLSYRRELREYNAIFGSLNHSVIQLANSYLALQAIGKRFSGLDSVLKFLQLSWDADTMADIVQKADTIHADLVKSAKRWNFQMTSSSNRRNYTRDRPDKSSTFLILHDILGLEMINPTTMITSSTDSNRCPYCLHPGHTLQTCWVREKDKALKENLGPLITEVAKVQTQLQTIMPNLNANRLTRREYDDMYKLLHPFFDQPNHPIYLAGKRLEEWISTNKSRPRVGSSTTQPNRSRNRHPTTSPRNQTPQATTNTTQQSTRRQNNRTLRPSRTRTQTTSRSRSPTPSRGSRRVTTQSSSPGRQSARSRRSTPRPTARVQFTDTSRSGLTQPSQAISFTLTENTLSPPAINSFGLPITSTTTYNYPAAFNSDSDTSSLPGLVASSSDESDTPESDAPLPRSNDTYSPMFESASASSNTTRILLSLANHLNPYHLDIKNAFLSGELPENTGESSNDRPSTNIPTSNLHTFPGQDPPWSIQFSPAFMPHKTAFFRPLPPGTPLHALSAAHIQAFKDADLHHGYINCYGQIIYIQPLLPNEIHDELSRLPEDKSLPGIPANILSPFFTAEKLNSIRDQQRIIHPPPLRCDTIPEIWTPELPWSTILHLGYSMSHSMDLTLQNTLGYTSSSYITSLTYGFLLYHPLDFTRTITESRHQQYRLHETLYQSIGLTPSPTNLDRWIQSLFIGYNNDFLTYGFTTTEYDYHYPTSEYEALSSCNLDYVYVNRNGSDIWIKPILQENHFRKALSDNTLLSIDEIAFIRHTQVRWRQRHPNTKLLFGYYPPLIYAPPFWRADWDAKSIPSYSSDEDYNWDYDDGPSYKSLSEASTASLHLLEPPDPDDQPNDTTFTTNEMDNIVSNLLNFPSGGALPPIDTSTFWTLFNGHYTTGDKQHCTIFNPDHIGNCLFSSIAILTKLFELDLPDFLKYLDNTIGSSHNYRPRYDSSNPLYQEASSLRKRTIQHMVRLLNTDEPNLVQHLLSPLSEPQLDYYLQKMKLDTTHTSPPEIAALADMLMTPIELILPNPTGMGLSSYHIYQPGTPSSNPLLQILLIDNHYVPLIDPQSPIWPDGPPPPYVHTQDHEFQLSTTTITLRSDLTAFQQHTVNHIENTLLSETLPLPPTNILNTSIPTPTSNKPPIQSKPLYPINICKFPECDRPCYPGHDYCCKRHAQASTYTESPVAQTPALKICAYDDCTKTCWPGQDYCTHKHAFLDGAILDPPEDPTYNTPQASGSSAFTPIIPSSLDIDNRPIPGTLPDLESKLSPSTKKTLLSLLKKNPFATKLPTIDDLIITAQQHDTTPASDWHESIADRYSLLNHYLRYDCDFRHDCHYLRLVQATWPIESWSLKLHYVPPPLQDTFIPIISNSSLDPSTQTARSLLLSALNTTPHALPGEREHYRDKHTLSHALTLLHIRVHNSCITIRGPMTTAKIGLALLHDWIAPQSYFVKSSDSEWDGIASFLLATDTNVEPPSGITEISSHLLKIPYFEHQFVTSPCDTTGFPYLNPEISTKWIIISRPLGQTLRHTEYAWSQPTSKSLQLSDLNYVQPSKSEESDSSQHTWYSLASSCLKLHYQELSGARSESTTPGTTTEPWSYITKHLLRLNHLQSILQLTITSRHARHLLTTLSKNDRNQRYIANLRQFIERPRYTHPTSLVATLNTIHLPGLSALEASRNINNFNIQHPKYGLLTPVMKDSGSNIHLIPLDKLNSTGIPELAQYTPSELKGIGTQKTLGYSPILFGLPTNQNKLHIYHDNGALIIPENTGPKCTLLSEVLLERAGYSWNSNADICQLTTPDSLTYNLHRDPISHFWFLLVKTNCSKLVKRRNALIAATKATHNIDNESTKQNLQKMQPPHRPHTKLKIPRPPWHSLPQSIEKMLRRTHETLGHISMDRILKLANNNDILGLEHLNGISNINDFLTVCEGCALGKMKLKPTPKLTVSRPIPQVSYGTMEIDTTGRLRKSLTGAQYALIAIHTADINPDGSLTDDGGTGFSHVVTLHLKSEVIMALQHICSTLKTHPRRIHSDNAKEFSSQAAKLWYAQHNINHTTTSPYEHHAVGKVERLQDTLKSLARAMMLHSGVPPDLWEFALKQANLIRNLTMPPPNKTAPTIWEAYYGQKPNVSEPHIFPFGCLAYIRQHPEQQNARQVNHSFGPRAIVGIYLGQDIINGASKHIILGDDRHLIASTSQNIIVNPDIYPYRPAATIPQSIANTALATFRFSPTFYDLPNDEPHLDPIQYLNLFVSEVRSMPATRSSKKSKNNELTRITRQLKQHLEPESNLDDDYYEADTILAHRGTGHNTEYLIRWTNYGPEHDSWQPKRNCTKALIREYHDKLTNDITPSNPDLTSKIEPQRLLPRDAINGDYRHIDPFAPQKDHRQDFPVINPLDFNLPNLPERLKEHIPYKDATYTHLTPTILTKAKSIHTNLTTIIGQNTTCPFDEFHKDIGTITAYLPDTNTWHISYLDDDYEIVDPETLSTMLLDSNQETSEHKRHKLLSHLQIEAIPNTYTTMKTPPKGQKQADNHPDAPQLKQAADEEINAFFKWGVFTETKISELPPGTDMLPSHIVYKDKTKINPTTGEEEFAHWRARLVIGGNKQKEYSHSYAPTPSWNTIRLIISYTSTLEWQVFSHDLEKAFVRTPITGRAIYVRPPPGIAPPNTCWRLNYSVYGLKDSNAEFNKLFVKTVLSFEDTFEDKKVSFQQCEDDPCLFILFDHNNQPLVIITAYIDDLILATRSQLISDNFLTHLSKIWNITDSDTLNKYLGIHFKRLDDGSWQFSAKAYIERALKKYTRYPINPYKTPLPPNYTITIPSDNQTTQERLKHYQSILGTLLYCAIAVRFDIIHAISLLAQFTVNPTEELVKMAYRVLGYLSSTKDLTITYKQPTSSTERHILSAYCDAGYAGCPHTRRSQEGHVILFNGGPISWCSKRQPFVSLSTCEAELVSLVNTAKQLIFFNKLLTFLRQPQTRIIIYEDNMAAITISEQEASPSTSRTKHMDTRFHWLQQYIQSGLIKPLYIPSNFNAADMFTKCLSPEIFLKLIELILFPRSNPALLSQD